jgi:hypothetical protein
LELVLLVLQLELVLQELLVQELLELAQLAYQQLVLLFMQYRPSFLKPVEHRLILVYQLVVVHFIHS